ncbi:MAG: hypothetical protein J6I45_01345 [Clostridia bacterium]|nr:hypothetical protein [Clostridia bacterium]
MKKTVFYTEAAYLLGIGLLAFGTSLMELADFGMSMIVAPAYLLHLKLSQILPFFSFGMAEYTLQAVLIVLTAVILRRFKLSYPISFLTALFYGLLLDGFMLLMSGLPAEGIALRIVYYCVGMGFCTAGVAMLFRTYISPEAYELFVMELSAKYNFKLSRVKTVYDCTSCVIAILLSFLFFGFGHFEGIKAGTVICALINGWLIGRFGVLYEKLFTFEDRFPLRKYFN